MVDPEGTEEEQRSKLREQLRERFRIALADSGNISDILMLEEEWAEVDDESARLLDDLA